MKSPNKERAAFSMGCLLERSLAHLIPGRGRAPRTAPPAPAAPQALLYKVDFQQRAGAGRRGKRGEGSLEDPCPLLLPNVLLMVK